VFLDGIGLGLVLVEVPAQLVGRLVLGAALLQLAQPRPVRAREPEPVPAAVAHGQGEHERRAAQLVDRAQHRSQVVGAAGGDLGRALRAAPHRNPQANPANPAVREPSRFVVSATVTPASRSSGVPQVRTRDSPVELSTAGEPTGPTHPGPFLALVIDALRARVLPAAARRVKSSCPFTESRPRHPAPPTVRAGAGAPEPGPVGPSTVALLSSTRARRPPSGPGNTADPAATSHRQVHRDGSGLRRPGAPPWTRAPPREGPTSGQQGRELRQWWPGRGLTLDGARRACQPGRTAATPRRTPRRDTGRAGGGVAPARPARLRRPRAAEGDPEVDP